MIDMDEKQKKLIAGVGLLLTGIITLILRVAVVGIDFWIITSFIIGGAGLWLLHDIYINSSMSSTRS